MAGSTDCGAAYNGDGSGFSFLISMKNIIYLRPVMV